MSPAVSVTDTQELTASRCCDQPPVFGRYCKEHFCKHVEDTVRRTIEDYKLILPGDKVIIAVSGGKDSLTMAFILNKLGYAFDITAIDEGIHGYRDKTLAYLQTFCAKHGLPQPMMCSFGSIAAPLDALKPQHPCSVCGTLRRYLLNKAAKGYDKIATGHNLDDEAQTILMNVLKGQPSLLGRLGPISKKRVQFTQRIKPLYFLTEKEILAYAFLQGFAPPFGECPHTKESFRDKVRQALNAEEEQHPGTKMNVVLTFLEWLPMLDDEQELRTCSSCGEASSRDVCKACQLIAQTRSVVEH